VQFVDTNNDGVLDAVASHPNTSTLSLDPPIGRAGRRCLGHDQVDG